jgi:ADP-heptose:LPS heptosyltransferase
VKQFEFEKQQVNTKQVSNSVFNKLGLSNFYPNKVETLDKLRDTQFNIVICECVNEAPFTQNKFKKQLLKKRQKYVMSINIFQQLWYDIYRNKKILKPAGPKFNNLYKPYMGQNLDNKTLLVSRTGGIGDLLFIQPNLIYLKEKYPTCIIKFACGPQYQDMIKYWDCIDVILDLPHTFNHFLQADYHAYFEGVIERCEEAHTQNSYNLFSRWLGLDLPDEKLVPFQTSDEIKMAICDRFLKDHNIDKNKMLLFQMRASSPIRTPRPGLWKDLMLKLIDKGYQIVITDNPAFSPNIELFIDLVKSDQVYNFATFSETLDFTIAMAQLAKCCVSTDSSLMHIAASLGVPAFGLYGPFPGEIRLTTYDKIDWINAKKECAPCFQHGPTPCRHSTNGHSNCYDNIDLDECVTRIERLINA